MKIGFIGAGKMGFILGKHFSSCKDESIKLLGYYSRNCESAKEAAKFTDTNYYANVTDLVNDSDAIFITIRQIYPLIIKKLISDPYVPNMSLPLLHITTIS